MKDTEQAVGKLSKEAVMVLNASFHAAKIFKQFKMDGILDFDPFCEYFALYYIQGRRDEIKRVMDLPEGDSLKKIPLIGKWMKKIDRDNEEFISVAQKSAEILEKATKHHMQNKRNIVIIDRTIPENEKYNLSVPQIEDAAKLTSAVVIKHEFHKINSKDLKRTVEEIKGKYKLPKDE